VVSAVAVCSTEGDKEYQIRERSDKGEINPFVIRVIQGFGRAEVFKILVRNAFLKI